jgi:lipopolysaccharide/colanic/teichoic acid biosynthesis glycosyltransferase
VNVATFSAVIPFYNLRHEVRPGLTGWAQVRAGYSMSTEEVTRKLCYDLYYIKHMSLRLRLPDPRRHREVRAQRKAPG